MRLADRLHNYWRETLLVLIVTLPWLSLLLLGAVWLWQGGNDAAPEFVGVEPEDYQRAEVVAGMADPETHVLDPNGRYFHFGRHDIWKVEPCPVD